MKKIVAAFDGLKFSESTRDYSIAMAKQNEALLVGVFLEDQAYHSYKFYELITKNSGNLHTRKRHLDKKDEKIRAVAIGNFEKACTAAGLNYFLHKDRHNAIRDLLRESMYADLLLIDNTETMSNHKERMPTHFIHELLPDVQCPILLVPHKYKPVKKLFILFDGRPSSVYAIKMFCYTLPAMKQYPVDVITVNNSGQKQHWPDGALLKEFMMRHLPHARYIALKGYAETEIIDLLNRQDQSPLVILGAYQRGRISRWIRESMADVLLREFDIPLFIAHH